MLLIGENLNVISKKTANALKQKDASTIKEMALAQADAGMDMIDINLGPARKDGPELMEWVVKTVQDVVDLPLSLDTTNIDAIEAGLKVHRGKALINSISARPERIEALMPLAKRYDAGFIGLMLGTDGIPRDANERGFLAAQIMAEAANYGIPEEDIWLDPIVLPINSQQMQVQGCTEFVMMLTELAPNSKSTCGLSNVSNGCPAHLRGILNRTYLVMIKRYGMYSAIVDAFDAELREIARGNRPDIESLIFRVMDGESIDMSALSREEADYVKTAKILLGHTLYSDSWLEL
ncbi:MAG TPA: dihydropteroate synthase [Syntrophorhabdaceae bacterium]|nr:dihydropteroate synthase [Syntrophorhabdaceae bacterium]OQC47120.1 MAG: 5-methyltetrahydrofolate:corrinoid/iron-sulfur protein co-methyltransferase [Deltaproteobacteria bacterium ADurb.Bin026]HNZ59411.1 dihydropteroate synthase [Syntrophorhabdaceae bacterium]HOB69244.1 dihydropteroate synthase [Syntrophorhabdaceae bacterium]HOF57739.1 dihydropteroate synthase [Syntrophorhabdaceae bacterium]